MKNYTRKLSLYSFFLLGSLTFASCTNNDNIEVPGSIEEVISPVQELFNTCYTVHGGDKFDQAHYQFEFRGNLYEFENDGSNYEYRKTSIDSLGNKIVDFMSNTGSFERKLNDVAMDLTDEQRSNYESSLNSVIYFVTLPHKLTDESVNKQLEGVQEIAGNKYDLMKVTFSQEGGGEDFDDEYLYWINQENRQIDYFAYNYQVNGGGVRFRSGFNTRNIDGILFKDYVNYEAPVGTPLIDLAHMFEKDSLNELSQILAENVVKID